MSTTGLLQRGAQDVTLWNALGYTLGAEGKRDCHSSVWRHRASFAYSCGRPLPRRSVTETVKKQPTFNVGLAEAGRIVAGPRGPT